MFEVEIMFGVPVNALLEKSILSISFLHILIYFTSNVFWHWKFQSVHMQGFTLLAFFELTPELYHSGWKQHMILIYII